MNYSNFGDLVGKTFIKIIKGDDIITFIDNVGKGYDMFHLNDCCESVYIEDINGDLEDLLNTPITLAEESTNRAESEEYESATWTFYKLATIKGYVDIRWFGTSNGYYSETADFFESKQDYKAFLRDLKIDKILKDE